MTWHIDEKERNHLRALAVEQAAIAALPVMKEREQMWYAHNDGTPGTTRPPVVISEVEFQKEFMTDDTLTCTSDLGRTVERQLVQNIFVHQKINDDRVIPSTFRTDWDVDLDPGISIGREHANDGHGGNLGFKFQHPITDLKRDLDLLKPPSCRVDRETTLARQSFLEDLLGDILPIERVSTGCYGRFLMLTENVVELMGMEAFFMAMYDTPDELHSLMRYLTDRALHVMRWAEREELLSLNNRNEGSCFGVSFNFTNKLPKREIGDGPVKLSDLWATMNSQETVGTSPEMFHEFCAPYYQELAAEFGMVYYGCCEPVHPIWDDIQQIPNLKKVSIPKWCDEAIIGEALRGTEIVYSRKPDPNFLSVSPQLDEDAWAKHIQTTLENTQGVAVEFLIRDVCTLHGNIEKASRAVAIARETIDRCRGR